MAYGVVGQLLGVLSWHELAGADAGWGRSLQDSQATERRQEAELSRDIADMAVPVK